MVKRTGEKKSSGGVKVFKHRKMRKQPVEGLLGRLPDFMAEERGRLKKRAFCKDYWREGKRVHGVCEIVRSFGGFLWLLNLVLLRQMGKDIRNPQYFDIPVLELDKRFLLLRAKVEGETKWEIRLREASDYLQFRKIYRKFDGMKFKAADGLEIHTLATPEEYAKEAEKMQNSIAGKQCHIMPESLILVARRGEKSVADIELHFMDWSIRQCSGPGNTTPPDEKKIRDLILRNINEIKRRHSCA